MNAALTKISPKGEMIFPMSIVKKLDLSDEFLVYASKDTIVLKKLNKPSRKERFGELCKKMGKHAGEMGIKKEYVNQLIHDCRKEINKIHILNKF